MYRRGRSFEETKQFKNAINDYNKVLELDKENVNAILSLAINSLREKKITSKTKLISITHLSNVTGAILPVKEITQLAHSKGIIVVVDGCQGAPHLKLDMQDLDCDFYAISCHKMYGPTGLGILYGKKNGLRNYHHTKGEEE